MLCTTSTEQNVTADFQKGPLVITGVLLAILAAYAHYPALLNNFSRLDDSLYVYQNTHVLGGLTWDGVAWAFSTNTYTYWHPLTWLSLMLDTSVYGSAAWGYHVTNFTLHILDTLLVFTFIFLISRKHWVSFAAAAIFAVHPIHVESVAWITARKDVLSTFFFMITAIAHLLGVRHGSFRYRCLSIAAYGLTLMAKPALLTAPFVLLLLDIWPLGRIAAFNLRQAGVLLKEKIPYFLLLAVALAMALASHPVATTAGDTGNASLYLRLANVPLAYVTYLRKLFWPSDLAIFYSFPTAIPVLKALAAVAVLVGITALAVWKARTLPAVAVGWLFFLGTMFPMIGLVQAGLWPALADRFAYLPFVGLYLSLSTGLTNIPARLIPRPVLLGTLAAVLAVLIPVTRFQASSWGDTEAQYLRATQVVPDNWMAFVLLGNSYSDHHRFQEAEEAYRTALAISPQNGAAYSGLGIVLEATGRNEESLEAHRESIRRNPHHHMGYMNLGWALERQGRFTKEAFDALDTAHHLAPTWPQPLIYLGNIYRKQTKYDLALETYRRALALDPGIGGSRLGIGLVLMETGHPEEAVREFKEEIPLNPNNPELFASLGVCLIQLNRLEEALPNVAKATQMRPGSAPDWNNLGVLLARMGRLDQAQIALAKALELDPGFERARASLEKVRQKLQVSPPAASPPGS